MIVSKFIVEASFTIVTYNRQNMFIIQATGVRMTECWPIIKRSDFKNHWFSHSNINVTLGIMTLSLTTLGITALGLKTLIIITTIKNMTLSLMTLHNKKGYTQHSMSVAIKPIMPRVSLYWMSLCWVSWYYKKCRKKEKIASFRLV